MGKTIKIMGAGVPEDLVAEMIATAILESDKKKYPVGCILFSDRNTNPSSYMGFGTWELWGSGMVPIGVDINNTTINASDKTIGSMTASIAHTHSTPKIDTTTTAATGNTGSTTPGNTGAASGSTGVTALSVDQIPAHRHWIEYTKQAYGGSSGAFFANFDLIEGYGKTNSENLYDYSLYADYTGGGQGHSHTLADHTHTSTAHSHSLGSHSHTVSVSAGTTGAASMTSISVVQPSIACYMWKRVA